MRTPQVAPITSTSNTGGCVHKYFTITRTDTVASQKIILPPSLIPVHATAHSLGVVSDAGTTATITLTGNSGTLATLDVKTALADIKAVNVQPLLALDKSDASITAVYAETGTGSTLGGPWLVVVECMAAGSV